MLDFDLIKNILIVAMAGGIITSAFVQKIKECIYFKKSCSLVIVSLFVSMTLGTIFTISFSNIDLEYSLWAGFFSFLGADSLYKLFEDKIFTPYSKIYDSEYIKIKKDNQIKEDNNGISNEDS